MTLYKGNKVIAGSRSYIGNIGDIKYTARVDLPFGGSWCDGSIKLKAQFPTVYQMLIDGKLQALDIATYESALNLNGSCGFFGLDTATESFRVPSLNDVYIKSGQVADEFGAESLPNITGEVTMVAGGNGKLYIGGKGSLYTWNNGSSQQIQGVSGSSSTQEGIRLNASFSSPAYQDGAKVNPDHVKYRAYVVLYTGADTNIDITKEIQLNNPFSFGMSQWLESDPKNASWLLSDGAFHSGAIYESFYNWLLSILNGEAVEGVSVKSSTDTYGDYDYVVNTTEATFRLPIRTKDDYVVESYENGLSWYRVYKSGWVEQGGTAVAAANNTLTVIGLHKQMANASYTVLQQPITTNTGAATDNYVSVQNITPTSFSIYLWNKISKIWYVCGQGAGTSTSRTYFYVGETVQDANLINASKVLDLLAKLESYDYVVESKVATDDDPTWYRVYKSGWVEQGGYFYASAQLSTIDLMKKYVGKDYSVQATSYGSDYFDTGDYYIKCQDKTAESFTVVSRLKGFNWEAKGQGA